MNKTTKKILIYTSAIIGFGVVGVESLLYPFVSGCGMDDGPFKATLINPIVITNNAEQFNLSDNGTLILENRNNTLSPILTLIENGKSKWTLDTDTRNTKGYESTGIWKITNVTINKKFRFN